MIKTIKFKQIRREVKALIEQDKKKAALFHQTERISSYLTLSAFGPSSNL